MTCRTFSQNPCKRGKSHHHQQISKWSLLLRLPARRKQRSTTKKTRDHPKPVHYWTSSSDWSHKKRIPWNISILSCFVSLKSVLLNLLCVLEQTQTARTTPAKNAIWFKHGISQRITLNNGQVLDGLASFVYSFCYFFAIYLFCSWSQQQPSVSHQSDGFL